MKKGFMILIAVLSALIITACSNSDELSGKTFDVSEGGSPNDPDKFYTKMKLEFLDEKKVINHHLHGEEGTYELKDDKLIIQFENENESLEIEFALEESDLDFSEYSAEISDSNFQIEDSDQVSKYQKFYFDLPRRNVEFIER
ncbi:hypothetical protein ACFSTA_16155 [Ornithinibacillus salinisoli]|uniref:Lipoprotein n=1 Tax=Ornithinibacillus salinisoli TaxID=1848459 RepID=A0ABW4W1C7_9BACI